MGRRLTPAQRPSHLSGTAWVLRGHIYGSVPQWDVISHTAFMRTCQAASTRLPGGVKVNIAMTLAASGW
jgi:hypothetical protein